MEKALDMMVEEVSLRDLTPLPADSASIISQFRYFFLLWTIKVLVAMQLAYVRMFHPSPSMESMTTRSYSCRPSLEVRIFTPKSRADGDNTLSHLQPAMLASTTLSAGLGAIVQA